jgi:hypothetical protein
MAGSSSSAVVQQVEQRRTFEEQTLQMAKLLMDEKTRLVSTESLLAQVTQARDARNLRGIAFPHTKCVRFASRTSYACARTCAVLRAYTGSLHASERAWRARGVRCWRADRRTRSTQPSAARWTPSLRSSAAM